MHIYIGLISVKEIFSNSTKESLNQGIIEVCSIISVLRNSSNSRHDYEIETDDGFYNTKPSNGNFEVLGMTSDIVNGFSYKGV